LYITNGDTIHNFEIFATSVELSLFGEN